MSNTKSSNQAAVPEAKGALDRFKFEVANELGVPLTDGYNGNLTSKQNGSVGGYMVKKIVSEQPHNSKQSNIFRTYYFNQLIFRLYSEILAGKVEYIARKVEYIIFKNGHKINRIFLIDFMSVLKDTVHSWQFWKQNC